MSYDERLLQASSRMRDAILKPPVWESRIPAAAIKHKRRAAPACSGTNLRRRIVTARIQNPKWQRR